MIKKLELKNFAAFKDLPLEFSSRVNIIIGENGFGKTQLLKAAYVLCSTGSSPDSDQKFIKSRIERVITEKLLSAYKPSNDKVGGLYHRGGEGAAVIKATFSHGEEVAATFTARSNKASTISQNQLLYKQGATFIPTKEVLSFLDGISSTQSDQATLAALFDATYFDLCKKLLTDPGDSIEEKTAWFQEDITNSIKGKFVFDLASVVFRPGAYKEYKNISASKTYFAPSKSDSLSITMTAEGFRKIGVIQRLLKNQSIGTGTVGPLFWDEPESNMNPRLMKLLVQILLELSRKEQQIVLATHDYVLLKWFDLLMDKGKDDHVRFHVLYRDADSRELKLESTDNYREISPNAIANTFSDLYDSEIKRSIGTKQ